MANKNRIIFFLIVLFLTALAVSVTAQDSVTGSGYYIDTRGGRTRFVQRLSWSGGENALRYEVVIQRQLTFFFQDHRRENTTRNFVEVTLQPGSYRFKVIPYDALNRPGQESEWVNFEVLRAYKPELVDASAGFVSAEDDGESGYILNIHGSNIVEGAEILIRGAEGADYSPQTVFSEDTGSLSIFIEEEKLEPGEYEIFVRNPGGLEASMGGILLSPFDIIPETTAELEPDPVRDDSRHEVIAEPEPEIVFEPEPEPEIITPASEVAPVAVRRFNESRYEIIEAREYFGRRGERRLQEVTWEQAKLEAERRGGHLATINSQEEQEFLFELIRTRGDMNYYWLGGRKIDGQWVWITGEPFNYTNWAPGQPDNSYGLEEYLEIARRPNPGIGRSKAGHWNDVMNKPGYLVELQLGEDRAENMHTRRRGFIIEYFDDSEWDPESDADSDSKRKKGIRPLGNKLFRFGVSYMPSFYFYGDENNESGYLAGGAFHLSWMGRIPMNVFIGAEALVHWHTHDNFDTAFEDWDHNIHIGSNILFMKWFANERAALSYRLGVVTPVNQDGEFYFSAVTGLAFHWRVFNNFTLDAGADYHHKFNSISSSTGYFRPWAGFSIQF